MAINAHCPIFDGAVADWNKLQVIFIHYVQFYHSIRGLEEPPSDEVIDNDELLDDWLLQRKSKMLNERRKAAGKVQSSKGKDREVETFDSCFK